VQPSDQSSGSIVGVVPESAPGEFERASSGCEKLSKIIEVPRRSDPDRLEHLLEPYAMEGHHASMYGDNQSIDLFSDLDCWRRGHGGTLLSFATIGTNERFQSRL